MRTMQDSMFANTLVVLKENQEEEQVSNDLPKKIMKTSSTFTTKASIKVGILAAQNKIIDALSLKYPLFLLFNWR